jgi:hypothetical protein
VPPTEIPIDTGSSIHFSFGWLPVTALSTSPPIMRMLMTTSTTPDSQVIAGPIHADPRRHARTASTMAVTGRPTQ